MRMSLKNSLFYFRNSTVPIFLARVSARTVPTVSVLSDVDDCGCVTALVSCGACTNASILLYRFKCETDLVGRIRYCKLNLLSMFKVILK